MYYTYLNGVLLPCTPSKLTIKVNNRNDTIDLVNGNEINILKKAGLTDIEFDVMIPGNIYPFAVYDDGFKTPAYFLQLFERLKTDEQPFQFIVTRTRQDGNIYWDTNITVSLEEYEIKESSEDGTDITVSVKLKQYKAYGTKKVSISSDGKTVTITGNKRLDSKGVPTTYTVKDGDTLWRICRSIVNDESKFDAIAKANNILYPNDLTPGTVLNLDV